MSPTAAPRLPGSTGAVQQKTGGLSKLGNETDIGFQKQAGSELDRG